jgi:arylsulfatase A-like enzyme
MLFLSHNTPHIAYKAKKELVEKNKDAFEPVYAAVIESLDQSVGQLLRKIDALGLRENTVVIFTSDNGGLHVPEGRHEKVTHNRPFRAGKGFVYEGGLRIPLIVRWPGKIPAGSVTDIPVMNTDWTPTFVEIAGRFRINNLDGLSLMPIFEGEPGDRRRQFFWHFPHYTNQGGSPAGAMREGDWKLIEHYEDGRLELFNLENDPGESSDLSKTESQRAENMRTEFHQWLRAVQAQTNSPNPDFNPDLHRANYEDYDVTRYDPPAADEAEFARVLEWRKKMNQATRPRP